MDTKGNPENTQDDMNIDLAALTHGQSEKGQPERNSGLLNQSLTRSQVLERLHECLPVVPKELLPLLIDGDYQQFMAKLNVHFYSESVVKTNDSTPALVVSRDDAIITRVIMENEPMKEIGTPLFRSR